MKIIKIKLIEYNTNIISCFTLQTLKILTN
jgi:hypothetical protein